MINRPLFLAFFAFIFVACNKTAPVTPVITTAVGQSADFTPTPLPPTATTEPTATPSPTKTPRPTKTPTATPSPTPTIAFGDRESQEKTFQMLWETVYERYYDGEWNGLDWEGLYQTSRDQIADGLTDEQFARLLETTIASLQDDHSVWISAEHALGEDAMMMGDDGYVGIGVVLFPLLEEKVALVGWAIPDNAASEAGIMTKDRLVAVDGEPICCDEQGQLLDLIIGPEGTALSLTVRDVAGDEREVEVERRPIQLVQPISSERFDNIGYIALHTFSLEGVAEQFRTEYEKLNANLDLQGLIIDLRTNGGGLNKERDALLALFTGGTLGQTESRSSSAELNVTGINYLNSQTIPLAILVGTVTNSNAEIFANILQEMGRATIIGNPTQGNVETIYPYDLPDGSRLWLAEEGFVPLSGYSLEDDGVFLDVAIEPLWENLPNSADDPAMTKAIQLLSESEDGGER